MCACVRVCMRVCVHVCEILFFPQLKVEVPPQVLWLVPLLAGGGELDPPEEQVGHVCRIIRPFALPNLCDINSTS